VSIWSITLKHHIVVIGTVFGLVTCRLVINSLRNLQNNKSFLDVPTGPTPMPKSDFNRQFQGVLRARKHQRDHRVLIFGVVAYL
jgi:hypothetical protein